VRDLVDDLKLHQVRREEAQRPLRAPFGRCAARQMNEPRFRDAVELVCARTRLPLTLDRGDQALHHAHPARSFDRRDPDAELVDDLLVGQARVGAEQDARTLGAVSPHSTVHRHRLERRTLVRRELDDVALHPRAHRTLPRHGPTFPSPAV